jgi:hypothetical protein
VRKPDTAYIQCPPDDEHDVLETCRGLKIKIKINT